MVQAFYVSFCVYDRPKPVSLYSDVKNRIGTVGAFSTPPLPMAAHRMIGFRQASWPDFSPTIPMEINNPASSPSSGKNTRKCGGGKMKSEVRG